MFLYIFNMYIIISYYLFHNTFILPKSILCIKKSANKCIHLSADFKNMFLVYFVYAVRFVSSRSVYSKLLGIHINQVLALHKLVTICYRFLCQLSFYYVCSEYLITEDQLQLMPYQLHLLCT